MMDRNDPQQLGNAIHDAMSKWDCSITEAADRVYLGLAESGSTLDRPAIVAHSPPPGQRAFTRTEQLTLPVPPERPEIT